MTVVGVTGLPCSGKSCAAEQIASGRVDGQEWLLLKADDIGHSVLARPDVAAELRSHFGGAVAEADDDAGMRRAIAARVFADPAGLAWLEGLVHPLVAAETARQIAARGRDRVVTEAALLFAAGMEKECDIVLVVEADFPVRLARAKQRGWDADELERREKRLVPLFASAWSSPEKDRLVRVENNSSVEALRARLAEVLPGQRRGTH